MNRILLLVTVVTLTLTGFCYSTTVTDDFSQAHDYLTQGVSGTIWHGFLGLNAGETAETLNASTEAYGVGYKYI
ncbi:MAG: hypothetical protein FVQ82_16205 [Planctomycetes bacterium]|nr:hypothetical protein [Planctomycetota bacterium]